MTILFDFLERKPPFFFFISFYYLFFYLFLLSLFFISFFISFYLFFLFLFYYLFFLFLFIISFYFFFYMIIRKVSVDDFQLVSLHEQFTNNKLDISLSQFYNFVHNLNNNHHIFVIEIDNKIIASATLIIENKLIHNNGKVAPY